MQAKAVIQSDGEIAATGVTTPVPWWSFTKTALAIALLRLSERGRIDLDRCVEGQPFTPVQLLRHEAGLPDYGALSEYHADVAAGRPPWSVEDLLERVEVNQPRYAPGQDWAYSNIGYLMVARLVEQASDRPLGEALCELVLRPAGLATARLAAAPADLAGVNMGDADGYHPGWVYHGLLVGTVSDAARLLRCLFAGALLDAKSLSRMIEGRALPRFRSDLHPDPAYGLGLMLSATNGSSRPIGHGGSGPGSRIAVYARQGRTCAVWAAASGVDPEAEVFRELGTGREGRGHG